MRFNIESKIDIIVPCGVTVPDNLTGSQLHTNMDQNGQNKFKYISGVATN